MASSIYTAWSVVAGEQPTTAKWNILGTNDGSFNTGQGFNDAIILPRHFDTSTTASSWVWQSWTPTWTNFTPGNATISCSYVQIGKIVSFRFLVVLGTTSAMGTLPTLSLPVTGNTSSYQLNSCGMTQSGGSNYIGRIYQTSTTQIRIDVLNASGTYLTTASITATTPFTWAANDFFTGYGTYQAA